MELHIMKSGLISALLIFLMGSAAQAQTDFVFEVNSLDDSGRDSGANAGVCSTGSTVSCPSGTCTECTLRAALETANTISVIESAAIVFADYIPTNSTNPLASMFFPVNGYNSIAREVHIDGASHPDWDPATGIPRVIIRGDDAVSGAQGLNFGPGGAGSSVDAVAVYSFPQAGIRINADAVWVSQSHIGINASGNSARPNAIGILVLGDHNVIGHEPMFAGTGPWPNIISGNTGAGVEVSGDHNLVGGNLIGLNKAGTSAVGNGGPGIVVEGTHARIGDQSFSGGPIPLLLTTSNVVAGNSGDQVRFEAGANSSQVACTRVGTNASGTARVGFGTGTALRLNSSANQVGNLNCRNIFAGQVTMGQGGTSPITVNFNTFEFNHVGTNADGDDLGEDMVGVFVFTGQGHQVRANTIGNGLTGLAVANGVINTIIQSNHIGVDADGNALPILFEAIRNAGSGTQIGGSDGGLGNRLGNTARGIDNLATSSAATIQNNWIGGLSDGTPAPVDIAIRISGNDHQIGFAGSGNRIANATDAGIELTSGSTAALVRGNRIGSTSPTAGGFGENSVGILVSGSDHVISDENQIGSQHTAIRVEEGTHQILDNRIGFDADLTPRPNSDFGIRLAGSENSRVIGNQVGFSHRGIRLNSGATGTVVGNNWLGVTPDLDEIGNGLYGYDSSGAFNYFGTDPDTAESLPNVVGFNGSGGGVRIAGLNNLVINNLIGFGPGGQSIPNGGTGALILRGNPAGTQVGLSTFSNANFIGNSSGAGIEVRESVSDVEIAVNQVGMFGSAPGPNQGPAIHLRAGTHEISMVGPPVGGSFDRLMLANSSSPAIVLDPDAGVGNRIQRIAGLGNSGKLIDLGPGGRDQDPGDSDTGPNNLQNFPEIHSSTSYDDGSQELTITFRVDSDPANSDYPLAIDVYRVSQSGTSHTRFGSAQYQAGDAGEWVTVIMPKPSQFGSLSQPVFAATATDALGNTSEMSDSFDTAPTFTVGGTVFNLEGEGLMLDLNGEEQLPVTGVGDVMFQFTNQIETDVGYEVTVVQHPGDQHCSVINGAGSGSGEEVNDVVVDCCARPDRLFRDRFTPFEGEAEESELCPLVGIIQADNSDINSCALRVDGTVWCWGSNVVGQLGDGRTDNSLVAAQVVKADGQPLTGIQAISSGALHTCAVDASGHAWCWGWGIRGQLGNGTTENRNFASPVMASEQEVLSGITQVSAGEDHSCGVLEDGTAWCWGRRELGRLGDGSEGAQLAVYPVQVEKSTDQAPLFNVFHIDAGLTHSCAIAGDGDVWCWGNNEVAQLGNGSHGDFQTRAVRVLDMGTSEEIADALEVFGWETSCLMSGASLAKCWGRADEGQTGDGIDSGDWRVAAVTVVSTDDTTLPLTDVHSVRGGQVHSCAIAGSEAQVYCWGVRLSGRLGDGQTSGSANAAQPATRHDDQSPLNNVIGLSVGRVSSCAVSASSRLLCWGVNFNGQLGTGDTVIRIRADYARRPAGAW